MTWVLALPLFGVALTLAGGVAALVLWYRNRKH